MQLGLGSLTILPIVSAASLVWPDIIPEEPIVGINLTPDYGTSTVLFPNGTFKDLAFVRGDKAYQDWIEWAKRSAVRSHSSYLELGAQLCPEAEIHEHKPAETFFSFSRLQRVLFPQYYASRPSDGRPETESEEHQALLSTNTPLRELLAAVKEYTETKLRQPITRVVVSYPGFFTEDFVRRIEGTMQSLSLLDDGCHADSRSPVAALAAHRQTEFDVGFSTRFLDFIHGPFGVEHVVHIENTQSYLIITAFQFFAGEHSSWAIRSFRPLTILEKDTTHLTLPGFTESDSEVETQLNLASEDTFWTTAQACLDYFFDIDAQETVEPHATYRLILTGTKSHDVKLLTALKTTQGAEALFPPNRPIAFYVHRPQEIISQRWADRRCHFGCTSDEIMIDGGLWYDYYDELLQSIRDETRDFSADINPVFAAARGAALLSLESRLRPCVRKCDMVKCHERRPGGGKNQWVFERGERERRCRREVAEL